MWISEWKEVSPRALGAPSFVKLFYYNIYVYTCAHVHTYTRVRVHAYEYVCVQYLLFFNHYNQAAKQREYPRGLTG